MRVVLAVIVFAAALTGCTYPRSPQFSVPAGQYPQAFDATRELLRSYRFNLERVDAAAGVITTAPKTTAGLATPWDSEQTSVSQEFEDLLNQQSRRVRVTFRPAVPHDPHDPHDAERALNQPVDPAEEMVGRVEVIIYRMETPGLRSPSRVISLTTLSTDPALTAEGIAGQYIVPMSQDSRLAARLAAAIERRLGPGTASAAKDHEVPPQKLARP